LFEVTFCDLKQLIISYDGLKITMADSTNQETSLIVIEGIEEKFISFAVRK